MKPNYVKHKIANLISINKIVTIHYYELDKNFSFEGERHNFWEMIYVDAGVVEVKAGSKQLELKQGEIGFHKPNEFHTLKANGKTAANVFVISFVCSSVSMNFFKGKTMTVPSKLKKYLSSIIDESERTFNLMAVDGTCLEIKENPPIGGQQMIRTFLEQFLIMLIRNEESKHQYKIFPTKESMENHIVSQMLHMAEDSIYSKISIQDICSSLTYSRAYLSRIFKEATGYTILEYAISLKIQEAKKLIREGNYNLTQISDLLEFDNPHYFSRVFKRTTGISPSEYKKTVKL